MLCISRPRIFRFSSQDTARLYNIFYGLSPTVSSLNHIPGFSLEGVSIPTCFAHLHTYFSCHATVSLNLDIIPFYRAHHRTPNTVSINHVFTTYIEIQHSVDLPCPHDIHRTSNTMSIYHGRTPNTVSTPTMHSHPTRCDASCINAMKMSLHVISCLHVRYLSHATYLLHYMSSVMDKLYLIHIIISIFITLISHNFTHSTCYSIYSNNTH